MTREHRKSRTFANPTANDGAVFAARSPDAHENKRPEASSQSPNTKHHVQGRAWDAEAQDESDTDTDVRPRDTDLVDETEDRE
jgi:hypothetical protein